MKAFISGKIANLTDGFCDHIARQRNDQIMFLRQRNKNIRGDPPLTGVIPAQQDLHADAFLRAGIE
ncbi:hypothetical protein D3C71_1702700 [compost metagenome]